MTEAAHDEAEVTPFPGHDIRRRVLQMREACEMMKDSVDGYKDREDRRRRLDDLTHIMIKGVLEEQS